MARAAKIFLALAIAVGTPAVSASAQKTLGAIADPPRGQLINRYHLTPTGETVPHPGKSQIGSESTQEKATQERSRRDTHSICSNCE